METYLVPTWVVECGVQREGCISMVKAADAQATVEALQAQLPAEMQGCTILFKECEKGHGRLVATNWRDHRCQTCEVEALQRERLREALREIAYDDIDLMQARALALTALTPAAKGGNGE